MEDYVVGGTAYPVKQMYLQDLHSHKYPQALNTHVVYWRTDLPFAGEVTLTVKSISQMG
jgi:hypothetical protein